ncbi:MAG: NUDIX domain-containing protein [Anaerolineaceae bacterium]
MSHQPYKFCPLCATPLVIRTQLGEERPTCPNCGWVHYEDPKVAAGVLILEENKVLLVRRIMDPFAGLWSIPAGFVNAFEDPVQAAIRECLEETGLTAQIDNLLDMLTGREHPRGSDILLIYQAHIVGGILHAADDAADANWFPLQNLPELAFNSTKKILARFTSP